MRTSFALHSLFDFVKPFLVVGAGKTNACCAVACFSLAPIISQGNLGCPVQAARRHTIRNDLPYTVNRRQLAVVISADCARRRYLAGILCLPMYRYVEPQAKACLRGNNGRLPPSGCKSRYSPDSTISKICASGSQAFIASSTVLFWAPSSTSRYLSFRCILYR